MSPHDSITTGSHGTIRRRIAPRNDAFQRVRHARYYEDQVLYHIIFRTTQGLWLLNPDPEGNLRRIATGVLGRAAQTFKTIRNHATVILSNHAHMLISGSIDELAPYIGFVKREISRRWGPQVDWQGIFEPGYQATAVISLDAQRRCLKYVLAQSVKEGIVEHPADWPGLHCAHSLVTGEPMVGEWFDGTAFGKAVHARKRQVERWKAGRISEPPPPVNRADYVIRHGVTFAPVPALAHCGPEGYRHEMSVLVDEVVTEGRIARADTPPRGVQRILAASIWQRTDLPPPPWFEARRRMVVWDDRGVPDVRDYLKRYWAFQERFREAADNWLDGNLEAAFPPASFRPGLPRPVPRAEDLVAAA